MNKNAISTSRMLPYIVVSVCVLLTSALFPLFAYKKTEPLTLEQTRPFEVKKGDTRYSDSRVIAQVNAVQAETLDGDVADERSRPTNAYLPKGTVDYCERKSEDGKFYNLAYGKRIYSDSDFVDTYRGILPSDNRVSVFAARMEDRHTVITFDVEWKAPFSVTLSPQKYKKPYQSDNSMPDYTIKSPTFRYVDIEFAYCGGGRGTVLLDDDPVFSSCEWIKAENGNAVFRLTLRKTGKFYGWQAEYDPDGRLEFYFLNPAKVERSDNTYGADLGGVVIEIDPGHGGQSSGAVGENKAYTEAVLNMILSNMIKTELESIGAKVVITRTAEQTLELYERNLITYGTKPDLFISVHRNSATNTAATGYECYYFTPFSHDFANFLSRRLKKTFGSGRGTLYYPFYVTRPSVCPAVLSEYGYVSNVEELAKLIDTSFNKKTAQATVHGIVDYFLSLKE